MWVCHNAGMKNINTVLTFSDTVGFLAAVAISCERRFRYLDPTVSRANRYALFLLNSPPYLTLNNC